MPCEFLIFLFSGILFSYVLLKIRNYKSFLFHRFLVIIYIYLYLHIYIKAVSQVTFIKNNSLGNHEQRGSHLEVNILKLQALPCVSLF